MVPEKGALFVYSDNQALKTNGHEFLTYST